MLWIKWLGIVVGTFAVPVIALATYGAMRWADATRALHFRLEAARMTPAPVQRFFRAVLTDGQPMIAVATVLHTGTFNMGESAEQWKALTSTQRVITRQPGFVWDGRVAVLPGLNVHVHDAYVAGEGILHPARVRVHRPGCRCRCAAAAAPCADSASGSRSRRRRLVDAFDTGVARCPAR